MSANPSTILPFPDSLPDLVQRYIEAKRDEESAKQIRLTLEERILALAPAREEGAQTTDLGNGFKLTTTGKLAYKCEDMDALREITRRWDGNLVPLKTTTSLDDTGCRYLRRERPELWRQLANVITTSPAKTSIKVGA